MKINFRCINIPNPASTILNVRMTDRKGTYRLINFLGQQVDTLSESGINVSTLETEFTS
jgi:hypothetical protein